MANFVAEIKTLQIAGYSSADLVVEKLGHEGYNVAGHEELLKATIKSTFEELGTPESIRQSEEVACLKDYLKKTK